jgi:hypothetical protein
MVPCLTQADTASDDDPNEISFRRGEIMQVLDDSGKWWQAQTSKGIIGSKQGSLLSPRAKP